MSYNIINVENAKTVKGEKKGYKTAILYLSPANTAGVGNMCPHSTAGCRLACLSTAGQGGMTNKVTGHNKVLEARKRKTIAFMKDQENFLKELFKELDRFVKLAPKRGFIPCIRLNGTSDVQWEKVLYKGKSFMEHFPDVKFYDYSKFNSRKNLPKNYSLTFSLAENNETKACVALENGINVSVIFQVARSKPLPATYSLGGKTFEVVNGDESDLRFLDKKGVIVGLHAKGRARKNSKFFNPEIAKFVREVA